MRADLLNRFFIDAIEAPHTFEQLRTASVGHILKPLIKSISDTCHHADIVSALLSVGPRTPILPQTLTMSPESSNGNLTLVVKMIMASTRLEATPAK